MLSPEPSPAPEPPCSNDKARLRERLAKRIRDFDVTALLALLDHLGYQRDQIHYQGHFSRAPAPTPLHDIAFVDQGGREQVLITVNIGLVSCRSPLPDYFYSILSDTHNHALLMPLLSELDNGLIYRRFAGYRASRTVTGWEEIRRCLLPIQMRRAPLTLDWLFRQVYPDMGVWAGRRRSERRFFDRKAYLGDATLGEAAMGSYAAVDDSQLQILLSHAGPDFCEGVSWLDEADRRLQQIIFPLLADEHVPLQVVLIQRPQRHDAGFDEISYLGFDPTKDERPQPAPRLPRVTRTVLFDGVVNAASILSAAEAYPAKAESA